jgi:RNA polymerase sigma-70 factor (ECF subfamily)
MGTEKLWHDWILQARRGDREAFDRLARENEAPLRSQIDFHLGAGLRSRVEIDDLLQETLLRAFRSMGQFEGETPAALRTWLAGIAHHAVVDCARRLTAKKTDYRREVALPAEPGSSLGGGRLSTLPSPSPSPSRLLRREERLDRLLGAVQTLSPDHRQVILLTLVERLPPSELARRMARSEKAVSMLLLRAMRALRESFGDTSSLSLPRPIEPGRGG